MRRRALRELLFRFADMTAGRYLRLLERLRQSTKVEITNSVLKVTEEVHNIAVRESAEFAKLYMKEALVFPTRFEVWAHCISQISGKSLIFLEFGVHRGESINWIASRLQNADVYGFDSFEGLEEDWSGNSRAKGSFNQNGTLPRVENNVTLIPGWFENSVPEFVRTKLNSRKVDLIHMDADTYKPTAFVLNQLSMNIGKGTIIIFDEFFGYNNWQSHEYKAFREFSDRHKLNYSFLAFSDMQVAIQIN